MCVREAMNGGAGVIVYFRKEGRALGGAGPPGRGVRGGVRRGAR